MSNPGDRVTDAQWALPSDALTVDRGDGGLLGKGAYGEVRRATYRGLPAAAKRLHALTGDFAISAEERAAVESAFVHEMEVLASLRHPNLLLFVGVTFAEGAEAGGAGGDGNLKPTPEWIVTEMMQYSLYNILHEKKLALSFAEIVDTATAVARGLAYLHTHDPPVIHRDISSKNVLVSGPVVKISDLGQAKVLAGTSSRNTAAPGAIVYAAPEVLTGSYTTAIDMFSFGVLLMQMVTGEFPSIEKRREQREAATRRFPVLGDLISRCLHMDPGRRYTADMVLRALQSLSRAPEYAESQHEHDGGIIAERAFRRRVGITREEGINAGLRQAQPKIEALARELGHTTAALEEQQALARDLGMRLEDAEARISTAESEGQRARAEAAAATRAAEEAHRHAEEMAAQAEKDIASARESTEEARKLAGAAEFQAAGERKERQTAEAALRDAQKSLRAARENRRDALQRMREAEEVEDRQRLAIENRNKQIRELNARMTSVQQENEIERDKVATLRKELHALEQRLAKETDARRQAEARAWESRMQIVDLRKQVHEQAHEATEANAEAEVAAEMAMKYETERDAARNAVRALQLAVQSQGARPATAPADPSNAGRSESVTLPPVGVPTSTPSSHAAAKTEFVGAEVVAVDSPDDKAVSDSEGGAGAPSGAGGASGGASGGSGASPPGDGEGRADSGRSRPGSAENERHLSGMSDRSRRGSGPDRQKGVDVDAVHRAMLGRSATAQGRSRAPHEADLAALGGSTGSLPVGKATQSSRAIIEAAKQHGVRAVVHAMEAHPARSGVQWRGCAALKDAAFSGAERRLEIVVEGGIAAVLDAMRAHARDAAVQQYGCQAVMNIAYESDANRVQLAAAGAVAAVAHAMALMMDDGGVQAAACGALANLAHTEAACLSISKGGGVDLVLEALRRHSRSPKVVQRACWALLALSANDAVAVQIAVEGGVEAVCEAMRACDTDADVLHYGCWAVGNIAWGEAEVRQRALLDGAAETVADAARRFPLHKGIQDKAAVALERLGVAPTDSGPTIVSVAPSGTPSGGADGGGKVVPPPRIKSRGGR